MLNEAVQPLKPSIRQVANLNKNKIYFFTSKLKPLLPVKLKIELIEKVYVNEIDEAVSYIALIFDIAGQIEEIISVGEYLIDFFR